MAGQTAAINLNPTGTIHFLNSFDSRFEIRGHYFYNTITRVMHIEPDDISCTACGGITTLPKSAMPAIEPFDVVVDTWTADRISGTGKKLNSQKTFPVSFDRSETFSVPDPPSTSVAVMVNYPRSYFNGKIGVLILTPEQGPRVISISNINNQSATYSVKIKNAEIGQNVGDLKAYDASLLITDDVNSIQLSATDSMLDSGVLGMSTSSYRLNVRLSSKVLSATIPYTENF